MKIQKIAFRNKWEMLANKITQDMTTYIKENYSKFEANTQVVKDTVYDGIDIKFIIGILENNKSWTVSINGNISEKTKLINIYIKINKINFTSSNWLLLGNKINKIVRHELEHFGYLEELRNKNKNFQKGYDPNKIVNPSNLTESFLERVNYLSQEYEKIAFIKALKGNAVRNNSSLISDIKIFIHSQIYTLDTQTEQLIKNKLSNKAIELEQFLINQYIEYALKTYPKIINYNHISNDLTDNEKNIVNLNKSKEK